MQDTIVGVEELTTMAYSRLLTDFSELKSFEIELYAFDGPSASPPGWCLDAYGALNPPSCA